MWFRYFEEASKRLSKYHPDDMLSPRQAAHALAMRGGTLFEITRLDKSVAPDQRIGPAFVVPSDKDRTFRPASMYRVRDLSDWIRRMADERRTIYGEKITTQKLDRKFPNLARMVKLSARNKTRAEQIAARFLLHVSADLTDTLAQQIVDGVSRRLTEQALREAEQDPSAMEIADAPLDNGFIKTLDNVPDIQWPLSDPRITGRSISQAQFILSLKALNMNPGQFAEFWGVRERTAYAWINGEIPIPLAVADYLKHVIGQFVRLRCIQLGVPVPATSIDDLHLPARPTTITAVDTLRAMLAEGNPDGRGHEDKLARPRGAKNSKRGFKRKGPVLTPRPDVIDPVEPLPEDA